MSRDVRMIDNSYISMFFDCHFHLKMEEVSIADVAKGLNTEKLIEYLQKGFKT
ncbi:hypothetical protein RhiirA4_470328 [Rhizophagus irregularis]|uniref:Uncharacterized protein n=1 Tax=Rhizophagus irregularis TaxID=588596 RepID=A0A2I1H165_9GLOM|nr:hypothetical protein RhiirA4_470328 [Rhizophagus irregularis]